MLCNKVPESQQLKIAHMSDDTLSMGQESGHSSADFSVQAETETRAWLAALSFAAWNPLPPLS